MTGRPIVKLTKVLVIDDSAVIRQVLTEILNQAADIEVVGAAQDPYEARGMIKKLSPDVLTLDIEMPKMNGIAFLENLMRLRPLPVVMISNQTEKGAEVTLRALEIGAIDFIPKPKVHQPEHFSDYAEKVVEKVRAAANVNINTVIAKKAVEQNQQGKLTATKTSANQPSEAARLGMWRSDIDMIALGASTGGTEAIRQLLPQLPKQCPAILIVQHLPVEFSHQFAHRLNQGSEMDVSVARHNEQILPGHVYIAPGDKHMKIEARQEDYFCLLEDSPEVNRHKPAVDVLFQSVALQAGDRALGVILTGMGRDGAEGMLAMKRAGCYTLAQDEKSCVVWGMPRQAVAVEAVEDEVPLDKIAEQLISRLTKS